MTDELRRVQDFCTSEPPPSDAARRAARSALSRATAEETTGLHPAIRPRRPRLRMLAIATAAVAAAAVVAGVFSSGGSPVGPSPATAAVFHRLARLIAAQPLTPGPGQYLYVESRSEYPAFEGSSCETLSLDHRQIWIGRDGSGLLRETRGPERFSSAADQAACLQVDPGMKLRAGGTSNDWFAPDCLALGPTNDWSSLSSDPRTLLQQMRKLDGGPPTAGEDFVHVGDFLRETDAPPAVRATIYRAAALIPGVELLGTVRDHDGRPGLGVAYSANGNTSELIFDPRTGELLGEQDTGPTGALQDWAVYLDERVANGLPSPPPAPLAPPCVNYGGYVHSTPDGDVTTGAPVN